MTRPELPIANVLIQGGTVVDGTGARPYRADVAISGERITAIGQLGNVMAARTIDASGQYVAPGFIDVHNHSDGWLLKTPHQIYKTAQGYTTEILASDGISYAPVWPETAPHWMAYLWSLDGLTPEEYRGWESIADYARLLDRRTAQNFAFQTPYANVRAMAKGWDRHLPDDTQVRLMQELIEAAFADGAVGVSTGLDYINQCFAPTIELMEVLSVVGRGSAACADGAVYATHVRYKKGLLPAIEEAVEIAARAGLRLHISHLKTESAESTDSLLKFIDQMAERVDLSFDAYPYMPGSTMLHFILPYEVWEDGPLGAPARLRDAGMRRRFAALMRHPSRPTLEEVRIAWMPGLKHARWQGHSLAEYVAASGQSPEDALCELLLDERLSVLCVLPMREDHDLQNPVIAHPRCMVGSDAIFTPAGPVHPRAFGAAPRILGRLVREREALTWEDAVRKLSGAPAERFGLRDRGVLCGGAFADVVVFDPATVADRATLNEPRLAPVGIQHVLVNGVSVMENGQPRETFPSGAWPGRYLRYGQ